MAKTSAFDLHSQSYEDWFEKNRYVFESEIIAVQKALPPSGNGIEIGVGSGRFAGSLGIKFGIEPSESMMQLALKRGIKPIRGTAENLPLKTSAFDYALMVTTICFLDNVDKALKETYRIIKNDGSIIVGFVDKDSPVGKKYLEHKAESVFYKEAVFYSTDEVLFSLRKAGFTVLSVYQTIFRPLRLINSIEPVSEGYGRGSFIVIKGNK